MKHLLTMVYGFSYSACGCSGTYTEKYRCKEWELQVKPKKLWWGLYRKTAGKMELIDQGKYTDPEQLQTNVVTSLTTHEII